MSEPLWGDAGTRLPAGDVPGTRSAPRLEDRDLWLWWLAILGMNMSLQMLAVAIGWED